MDNSFDQQAHDAFLRWFTKTEPALRGFVRSLVPGVADADDVLQEVAITLWKKFDEFEGESPEDFRRWAFTVAKFKVLSWKRDLGRDRHLFSDELLGRLAEESGSRSMRLTAQREALEICIAKLPKIQRSLVDAAYAPKARMDELASSLGRTAMAVYKQLHRIRFALLECVNHRLKKEGWEV
ncbi:MAG: sigma-70 family RNA polymerase sigma factor [Verrucomicrobiota bacterium]